MTTSNVEDLRMMTSVAQPVFGRNPTTAEYGHLLGVMGTDVPLKELLKLTPQFQLGPNGYSFAITNNGYILFHPDLRPIYKGHINTNYNSIDLSEVELETDYSYLDDEGQFKGPDFSMALRKAMINHSTGSLTMQVVQHYDYMRRVMLRNNSYYYTALNGTPFALGIALTSDYRAHGTRDPATVANIEDLLPSQNWTVPETWAYCTGQLTNYTEEETPSEDRLLDLIRMSRDPRKRDLYIEHCRDWYDIVGSLIYDADVTKDVPRLWDATEFPPGIELVFLGTRSGLTRYRQVVDAADHGSGLAGGITGARLQ
ncbi:PREDICTED: voltage-dependent calcium channel subunit alpha-2/delta-3-like [Priapulus caudatus]|uniref:Voltage-dependent calcium channel subunit alpha-2/delta-3-like n=1 Tax=Priapulus caudatus TaxID=37621 RepID=A0ABM1EYV4_PRICU|nr:PREDICTED: voltage-dependent calcium channel subunit alpha-2/delta-3-like [Priapulus caudatus]